MTRTFSTATFLILWATVPAIGQMGAQNGEWRTYGGDLGNTHYSPLDQINASNFYKLQVAWRFKTDNLGPRVEFNFEGTPLMANGVLYSTAGTRRAVVAIDAATGELIWTHGEREGPRGTSAPRVLSGRGLSYWTDGREERILYVTPIRRAVVHSFGAVPPPALLGVLGLAPSLVVAGAVLPSRRVRGNGLQRSLRSRGLRRAGSA